MQIVDQYRRLAYSIAAIPISSANADGRCQARLSDGVMDANG
jgi:hypothetical protein